MPLPPPQDAPDAGALVAVDLGNTHIGVVVRGGGSSSPPPAETLRFRHPTADATSLAAAWARAVPPTAPPPTALLLASVHPPAEPAVAAWARSAFGLAPLRPRTDFPLPLTLAVDDPAGVGIDRQLNAFAAARRAGRACLVVSCGTAITVDAVSEGPVFRGGAILPGLGLAAAALADRCALLPRVAPGARPTSALGRDTESAIRAGLWAATAGGIRRLLDQARAELGDTPDLFFTGGDAALLAPAFPEAVVVEGLVLEGLLRAWDEAHAQRRSTMSNGV